MAEGGKFDDIIGPGGETPGGPIWIGDPGGSGGGPSPGGPGFPNPFIPGFLGGAGGQAQGFAGFGADSPWSGMGGFQPRRRLAGTRVPFGAGQTRMEGGGGQMGSGSGPMSAQMASLPPGAQAWFDRFRGVPGSPFAQAPGSWQPNGARELVADIIAGGKYGMGLHGGIFGPNPPPGILAAIRGQAVQDAGARERSARLGLQTRGDTDASTYGFQALMSQLGGQDQTARAMSGADLALRQQQLAFLQNLLGQYLGAGNAWDMQNRQNAFQGSQRPGFLGQAAGALGGLAGMAFGGGMPSGGGGGPTMGQPGFQYPYGG